MKTEKFETACKGSSLVYINMATHIQKGKFKLKQEQRWLIQEAENSSCSIKNDSLKVEGQRLAGNITTVSKHRKKLLMRKVCKL